jgi:hypothetical protein
MQVIMQGHIYDLNHVGGKNQTRIQFVNKEPGTECEGVTTQEILRMLIDRTHYCHNCLPHRVNAEIIWHFRQALALHEARAIERKVAKGEINPEAVILGQDGHFKWTPNMEVSDLQCVWLKPVPKPGEVECDHHCTR